MEFVIWGIGLNSLDAFDLLQKEKVIAFIDSNRNYIGKLHLNLPVISFDEYKNNYRRCFIIISPAENRTIIELIETENIYNYLLLSEIRY